MICTGVERKLDELGRIVLPKEIRNSLNLPTGTPLLISVDGSKIILEKSTSTCAFCANTVGLKEINGKHLCLSCIEEIKKNG